MNAINRFTAWFDRHGHWMYDKKADALDAWVRRGIESIPTAPANAKIILKDWAA